MAISCPVDLDTQNCAMKFDPSMRVLRRILPVTFTFIEDPSMPPTFSVTTAAHSMNYRLKARYLFQALQIRIEWDRSGKEPSLSTSAAALAWICFWQPRR